MKVQIEINEHALSVAILSVDEIAKPEIDNDLFRQAIERCENEVTEIDVDKFGDGIVIQTMLAVYAIVTQGERIKNERVKE